MIVLLHLCCSCLFLEGISLLVSEREFTRTARVCRETGCMRLLTTRVSGGTPRRFSCPGKDLKTLAPDVFGGVDVGVGFVSATQALENRLADPVMFAVFVSSMQMI